MNVFRTDDGWVGVSGWRRVYDDNNLKSLPARKSGYKRNPQQQEEEEQKHRRIAAAILSSRTAYAVRTHAHLSVRR